MSARIFRGVAFYVTPLVSEFVFFDPVPPFTTNEIFGLFEDLGLVPYCELQNIANGLERRRKIVESCREDIDSTLDYVSLHRDSLLSSFGVQLSFFD